MKIKLNKIKVQVYSEKKVPMIKIHAIFLYEQDLISWSVYSMNIRNFIYFLNNFYELKIVLVAWQKKALMFEKSTIINRIHECYLF